MNKKSGCIFLTNHRRFSTYVLNRCSSLHVYFRVLVALWISIECVQASTDPTSFACSTYNSSVIALSWTPATDVSINGYYLYLTRTDGLKTQNGPGITLPARNYASYTFYGLGFYAQYDISISSYSGGTNYTVITSTCTTSQDNPDLSNFNLTCEGISYTEISCTWGSLDAVYWNGVPFGWQLGHISYYNDEYTYLNFNTTATLAYTITGLQFDTKYLINLRSVNTGAFLGPYSSTNSKTLGWPDNSENATRYFCYQAVPGTLEFGWLEMTCAVYSAAIAGLLLLCLLLLLICCCQCCCKGDSKKSSNTVININNEENNEYYGGGDDDDDDDEYDESEEEEEDEEEYDDEEDEDVSDGDASPVVKKKPPVDEETEDEEEDEEEAEEESDTDDEIYAGMTKDEKDAKKKEREAEKQKKKDEKAKEKADKLAKKKHKQNQADRRKDELEELEHEERKQKIRDRMKQKNAKAGGTVVVVTKVDETKKDKKVKEKKKANAESSDEESEGYYEDWNPDADDNPDVAVQKVSKKDENREKDSKREEKASKRKEKDKKSEEKSDRKSKSKTKNKNKSGKGKSRDNEDSDDDDDEDDDYDSEYDSDDSDDEDDEDYSDEDDNKPAKGKSKKNTSKDSGRGSASSNSEWGDSPTGNKSDHKADKSKDKEEPKKKGGFLSKLFGGPSKPKAAKDNKSTSNNTKQGGNKVDYGDWDDDDDDAVVNNVNNTNTTHNMYPGQQPIGGASNNPRSGIQNSSDQYGNPIIINAPTIMYGNPSGGNGNQGYNQHEDRTPPGYGRNPNGTFHPLPGNYNRNAPPGFVHNPDGSIQRSTNNPVHDNSMNNNPPPGYAKNFDGTFYPVPGNTNPIVPPGFIKNPDGTIYKNPQQRQQQYNQQQSYNISSAAPPGYGKNPDGTFYPLPGNYNPVVPPGFKRNHDGTIRPDQSTSQYAGTPQHQGPYNGNQPPPGYSKNPDGTFYPNRGNRYPVVPPGFAKNSDGSIYRVGGTAAGGPAAQNYQHNPHNASQNYQNYPNQPTQNNQNYQNQPPQNHQNYPNQPPQNYQSQSMTSQAPPGYSKNTNGTFHPLPSNRNPIVPQGFAKNPDGSIYRTGQPHMPQQPSVLNSLNATPPTGYGKNNDGSFYPLSSNRNPVVPEGYAKNPDGSIYQDPYQSNSNSYDAPPPGYTRNPNGTFRPLPSNRNPVIPPGFVRNPDGSITNPSKAANIHNGNFAQNDNVPPKGYVPNADGSFIPLPGNRNPIVPPGFTRNGDGSIRKPGEHPTDINAANNEPSGYARNPDGTYRRLPWNKSQVTPAGFSKNPDGTIRRNRNNDNTAAGSNNYTPPGYGKNPDGTFYPLNSNSNPVVPEGFRKNPDGTISKMPHYTNRANANGKYPTGHHNAYPNNSNKYGPADLDQPLPPDDRDKFNELFVAKARRKAAQKRGYPVEHDNPASNRENKRPNHFNGDGDDIFAPNGGQNVLNQGSNGNPGGQGRIPVSNQNGQNRQMPNGQTKPIQQGTGNIYPQNTPGTHQDVGNNNPHHVPGVSGATAGNNAGQSLGPDGPGNRNAQNPHADSFGPHGAGQNYPNDIPNGLPGGGNQNATNPHGPNQQNQTTGNGFDNPANQSLPRGNRTKQPFSFGRGNLPDTTVHNNRKPISFRQEDPKYRRFSQDLPLGSNVPNTQPGLKRNSLRNDDGHGDTSDTEVLPDDRPSSRKKPIRFRNPNLPAWDSKRSDGPKAADRSGKKTPVTELGPKERQELTEPEPIIASDRLGNKFPFLNVNNKNDPKSNGGKPTKDGDIPDNKPNSDAGPKIARGREWVNKKDLPKRDFPPLPNTLTGEDGAIAASDNLGGLDPETRAQIFYGFGVGRWRKVAAKWLSKWKMKKKPVNAAKSSWD